MEGGFKVLSTECVDSTATTAEKVIEKVRESGGKVSWVEKGKMGNGANGSGANVGGGFRSKIEHFMYSGDKKHVMAGIAIITVVFGAPWFLMSRGSKHQSHQDYLEKADKARSARLSTGSSPAK